MTKEDRRAKAILHKELTDLLTNCRNDTEFLKRLLWATEIIENDISQFSNEEILEVSKTI